MSIVTANASITHTFGNVACVAMEYIKSYFEPEFFQTVHISTKMAHKQLDVHRTKNPDFWKLQKPMLILRPRVAMDDSSKYWYGSNWMSRTNNIKSGVEFGNLNEILKDLPRGVQLQFLWNRIKINYDVVIIVDTWNEQINLTNYLMNAITPDCPFMIHTSLESYIPRNVVYRLADHLHIPHDQLSSILSYLNTYGFCPFTYKLKDGSGNDEFFAMYDTNVETIVSDINLDDGVERNMITDSFTLSFTMSCEFNTMALFYLLLRDGSMDLIRCPHNDTDNKGVIRTLFTIPLIHNVEVQPGWKMILACPYFVPIDGAPDETDLSPLIPEFFRNVLKFQKGMGLREDAFFQFIVFQDRKRLLDNEEYFIDTTDVNHIRLYTLSTNHRSTYRVVILAHMELIHQMKAEMEDFYKEK